jgi:hypothetical protein
MMGPEATLKGKVSPSDPPDEPTTPPMRLVLWHILSSLAELTGPELYYLKGAVVDAQEGLESRQVLAGMEML